MISGFVSEKAGLLRLTEEQWKEWEHDDPGMATRVRQAYLAANISDPDAPFEAVSAIVMIKPEANNQGFGWDRTWLIRPVNWLSRSLSDSTQASRLSSYSTTARTMAYTDLMLYWRG